MSAHLPFHVPKQHSIRLRHCTCFCCALVTMIESFARCALHRPTLCSRSSGQLFVGYRHGLGMAWLRRLLHHGAFSAARSATSYCRDDRALHRDSEGRGQVCLYLIYSLLPRNSSSGSLVAAGILLILQHGFTRQFRSAMAEPILRHLGGRARLAGICGLCGASPERGVEVLLPRPRDDS